MHALEVCGCRGGMYVCGTVYTLTSKRPHLCGDTINGQHNTLGDIVRCRRLGKNRLRKYLKEFMNGINTRRQDPDGTFV